MITSRKRALGKWAHSIGILETLERRRMLAGNVTAALDPVTNEFHVIGDGNANQIQLMRDVDTGTRTLIGLDGTTINGGASAPVPDDALAYHFDMGGGDDLIHLLTVNPETTSTLQRPATFDTGNGSDTLILDRLAFGNMTISTGNGGDDITVRDLLIVSTLNIDTGSGADTVTFEAPVFDDNDIGNVTVDGQNGPDALTGVGTLNTPPAALIIDDVEVVA